MKVEDNEERKRRGRSARKINVILWGVTRKGKQKSEIDEKMMKCVRM